MAFEHLRQSRNLQIARMAGFYLAVVAFVGLWLLAFNTNLLNLFTVWFDESLVDVHIIHNATLISMIWVFGLAMLVQLYRPRHRITTMQMALLLSIVGLFELVPALVLDQFDPMPVLFFALAIIAAALHPARDEVFGREQLSRDTLDRPLLGLAAVALVPVGLYAIGQLNLQMTLTDEHAAVGHYSGIALYSVLILVYAALASLGGPPRRAAAYATAFLAFVLATFSTVYPAASAIGPLWSGATVLWGLAVIGAFEWSVRSAEAIRSTSGSEQANRSPRG